MIRNHYIRLYLFTLLIGILLLLTGTQSLKAQAGLGAAGAHVATDEFNFSYSVGQMFNIAIKQSDYYVSQGIQHPMLMVLSDTPPDGEESVQMNVYPNPVAHELYIGLHQIENKGCIIQLMNMNGQVLIERSIESENYVLSLEAYDAGQYLLRVVPCNSDPKTFKIIKTK